ncbi:unnamed protein product [Amoebophrya sp. A120]|nr:unnamed protein product [Amoebophrya sp. A120]|eukprot:GSA120T00025087001.1
MEEQLQQAVYNYLAPSSTTFSASDYPNAAAASHHDSQDHQHQSTTLLNKKKKKSTAEVAPQHSEAAAPPAAKKDDRDWYEKNAQKWTEQADTVEWEFPTPFSLVPGEDKPPEKKSKKQSGKKEVKADKKKQSGKKEDEADKDEAWWADQSWLEALYNYSYATWDKDNAEGTSAAKDLFHATAEGLPSHYSEAYFLGAAGGGGADEDYNFAAEDVERLLAAVSSATEREKKTKKEPTSKNKNKASDCSAPDMKNHHLLAAQMEQVSKAKSAPEQGLLHQLPSGTLEDQHYSTKTKTALQQQADQTPATVASSSAPARVDDVVKAKEQYKSAIVHPSASPTLDFMTLTPPPMPPPKRPPPPLPPPLPLLLPTAVETTAAAAQRACFPGTTSSSSCSASSSSCTTMGETRTTFTAGAGAQNYTKGGAAVASKETTSKAAPSSCSSSTVSAGKSNQPTAFAPPSAAQTLSNANKADVLHKGGMNKKGAGAAQAAKPKTTPVIPHPELGENIQNSSNAAKKMKKQIKYPPPCDLDEDPEPDEILMSLNKIDEEEYPSLSAALVTKVPKKQQHLVKKTAVAKPILKRTSKPDDQEVDLLHDAEKGPTSTGEQQRGGHVVGAVAVVPVVSSQTQQDKKPTSGRGQHGQGKIVLQFNASPKYPDPQVRTKNGGGGTNIKCSYTTTAATSAASSSSSSEQSGDDEEEDDEEDSEEKRGIFTEYDPVTGEMKKVRYSTVVRESPKVFPAEEPDAYWSDDEGLTLVPQVLKPKKSLLLDFINLESKVDEEGETDFGQFQSFFREWLEEKELFEENEIESRPLDDLLDLMAEEEIGEDDIVREVLKDLDGVLTKRCKTLETVQRRDVRPEQKTWVCQPCLYLPPKDQWIDLDAHPEAWQLLSTVRIGTPQQIHDAIRRCKKLSIGLIRDKRGRCVMHYAAQKGNVAALEYFGPLANALDREGWAPLHYAAYFGNRVSCDRLVQLGADIDMPCLPNGKTPFDYAEDSFMKCTMTTLALNGANSMKARRIAHAFIETLSVTYRKKLMADQLRVNAATAAAGSGIFGTAPQKPKEGAPEDQSLSLVELALGEEAPAHRAQPAVLAGNSRPQDHHQTTGGKNNLQHSRGNKQQAHNYHWNHHGQQHKTAQHHHSGTTTAVPTGGGGKHYGNSKQGGGGGKNHAQGAAGGNNKGTHNYSSAAGGAGGNINKGGGGANKQGKSKS